MDEPIVSLPTAVLLALVVVALILWWMAWIESKKEPPKKPPDKPKESPPKPKEPKAPGPITAKVQEDLDLLRDIIDSGGSRLSPTVVERIIKRIISTTQSADANLANYELSVKRFGDEWDKYPK